MTDRQAGQRRRTAQTVKRDVVEIGVQATMMEMMD